MNVIIINGIKYNFESFWRSDIKKKTKDYNGKLLPFPKEDIKWVGQESFISQLSMLEEHQRHKKQYIEYEQSDHKNCLLCHQKNITKGIFEYKEIYWEDGLSHYIRRHNIKPDNKFIQLVYNFSGKKNIYLTGSVHKINDLKYVKLDQNELLIMDALMEHGGYTKKYIDKNKKIYRYSEHFGLLDFKKVNSPNKFMLEKIIISGNTTRVDEGDDEILFPHDST